VTDGQFQLTSNSKVTVKGEGADKGRNGGEGAADTSGKEKEPGKKGPRGEGKKRSES